MSGAVSAAWILLILTAICPDSGNAACSLLESLQHGELIYQSSNPPNEVSNGYKIRAVCNDRYRLEPAGDGFMTCTDDGWSETYTCVFVCEPLPPLPHGEIAHRLNGLVARYSCTTPGYRLEGVRKRRCSEVDGVWTWDGSASRCRPMPTCPAIELPPFVQSERLNGRFRENLWTYGSKHLFSCQEHGFELEIPLGIYPVVECLRNGWNASVPTCSATPACPAIELPPRVRYEKLNGHFLDNLWTIGSRHTFTCEGAGYFIDIPLGTYPAIECLRDGWNTSVPICSAITCAPLLEEIPNGRSTAENRTYTVTESIEYICNPGYRTDNPSWRVCASRDGPNGVEGLWDGVTPRCVVTTCPQLPRIQDGTTVTDSMEVGGNGTFRCNSGFSLIGDAHLTCLSTGQWNGTVPVCDDEESDCPILGAPLNGHKEGNQYHQFARVGFSCDRGKTLIGSAERTCRTDGQWSGEPARCMGPLDFDDVNQIASVLGASIDGLKSNVGENTTGPIQHNDGSRLIPLSHKYGVDLYFMFDASESIGEKNFNKAKNFAKELVREIGVTSDVNSLRVGAMYFSSEAIVAFHTVDYDTTEDVVNAINRIPYVPEGTNIALAFDVVLNLMITLSEVRDHSFRTAFLLTDGESTEGGSPGPVADALKGAGIKIHCLGISEMASRNQLSRIASDPKKEYLFFLKDYDSLNPLIKAITNQSIDYSECGVSRYTISREQGDGEVEALPGAWPWQVYLKIFKQRYAASGDFEICGGTLVRNDTVLTAAHCVNNFAHIEAYFGITKRSKMGRNYQERRVEPRDIIIHPDYNDNTKSHDIALIHLDEPLTLTQNIRTACLPDAANEDRLLHKRSAIMTGWGHGEPIDPREEDLDVDGVDDLQQLPLPLKTRQICEESLENDDEAAWWDETMTCAGYMTKQIGPCIGDSGGPLIKFANHNGRRKWTVIGITSWGRGCAWLNELDFFTNVPHFVDWINLKMNQLQNAAD